MRAFKLFMVEDEVVVLINDRRLKAAMLAFNYFWEEGPCDGPERTELLVRNLEGLLQEEIRRAT